MNFRQWKNVCSPDVTRPVLTGVYFDLLNGVMVGTDSHMLIECPVGHEFSKEEQKLSKEEQDKILIENSKIVPVEFFNKSKYFGSVKEWAFPLHYDFSDEHYAKVFNGPELVFQCRFIEGKFPNYKSVRPDSESVESKIELNMQIFKRIADAIPLSNKSLIFTFHGSTKVMSFESTTDPGFRGIVMPVIF